MNNVIVFSNAKEKILKRGNTMCTILERIRNKKPEELLQEYKISAQPPVDISALLESIGISTIAFDFSEIEQIKEKEKGSILGAAFSKEDALAIFYKESDTYHRAKFTIAHELAHCCLHCPENESSHIQYRFSHFEGMSEAEYEKEKEANIFAGKLLIPKETLEKYYEKMMIPSLQALADIFDVSTSVMAARLEYLGKSYYKDSRTPDVIL